MTAADMAAAFEADPDDFEREAANCPACAVEHRDALEWLAAHGCLSARVAVEARAQGRGAVLSPDIAARVAAITHPVGRR